MIYLKRLIYSLSIIFILLASLLTFLFTTSPGLYTTIKLLSLFLPGKIHIQQGTGRLINHFSFSKLTYAIGGVQIQISQGSADWQLKTLLHRQLTITAAANTLLVHIKDSSHINMRMPKLPFNLQINKLTINHIRVQHINSIQHAHQLELQASLNNKQWVIHSLKSEIAHLRFNVKANGQVTPPYATSAILQFSPLKPLPYGVQGDIKLEGDIATLRWQGQFNGLVRGDIRGTLKNGFELQTDMNWSVAKWPISTSTTLASHQGHLTINGTLPNVIINANTHIETPVEAEWQITAQIKNKHTDINSTLHLPQSHLNTAITAKGTLYDTQHGKLIVTVNPGSYQLPKGSPIPTLFFKGGDLLVNLTPEALQATGVFTIDPQKTVNLALRIPKFHLTDITTKQAIDGKLNLHINSLDFLQGFSKAVENIHGQLQMNLTATGLLAKPTMKGELLLTNASLSIPKSGLTFSPIQARLQSNNNHWQAQGSITSIDHVITLKGQGDFSPQATGQLSIIGDNFTAIKTANYTINLSPQLAIHFNPTSFYITGNILVPSAQLKPLSFSNTVSLSEDVVFVSKEETTTNPFNISTDVQIKMGQDVALDVKGLRGFLDGAIRIKQLPQSPLNASGELTIRDGKYQAYGQDLVIDQGQLTFTGGLIDNPGIHIRAIRKFSNANSNIADTTQSLDFSAANLDTLPPTCHNRIFYPCFSWASQQAKPANQVANYS